jgi:hypothetical protein
MNADTQPTNPKTTNPPTTHDINPAVAWLETAKTYELEDHGIINKPGSGFCIRPIFEVLDDDPEPGGNHCGDPDCDCAAFYPSTDDSDRWWWL